MKKIFLLMFISAIIGFTASAQYDKCAPSAPVFAMYYTREANTKYAFGLEAGVQGMESRFGIYAGFNFKKMSSTYMQKDSTDFGTRGSLYIRGAYRLTQPGVRGSVFLTAAPEISVQTGFDLKTGLRFMMPLGGKKAIGFEPQYSFKQKTLSFNLIASF